MLKVRGHVWRVGRGRRDVCDPPGWCVCTARIGRPHATPRVYLAADASSDAVAAVTVSVRALSFKTKSGAKKRFRLTGSGMALFHTKHTNAHTEGPAYIQMHA
jgi:hypothetical protein